MSYNAPIYRTILKLVSDRVKFKIKTGKIHLFIETFKTLTSTLFLKLKCSLNVCGNFFNYINSPCHLTRIFIS